jgi:hypothetical protein
MAAGDLHGRDGPVDAGLCGARWLRPRRRACCCPVPMRIERRGRRAKGPDDRQHRPVLGCQRNLAGARRGHLLTCFPLAHGVILSALYLPVALMLIGLILRGVAFDFRVKARAEHKHRVEPRLFCRLADRFTWSQGWMLGHYITGFEHSIAAYGFAASLRCAWRRATPARRDLVDLQNRGRAAAAGRALGPNSVVAHRPGGGDLNGRPG